MVGRVVLIKMFNHDISLGLIMKETIDLLLTTAQPTKNAKHSIFMAFTASACFMTRSVLFANRPSVERFEPGPNTQPCRAQREELVTFRLKARPVVYKEVRRPSSYGFGGRSRVAKVPALGSI
jgi:hypothetical protein